MNENGESDDLEPRPHNHKIQLLQPPYRLGPKMYDTLKVVALRERRK